MGKIISVHSYRGGTGKSNVTANLAWIMATAGKRVAVLDTDLQSPGVHMVFGFDTARMTSTLTDFIFGKCEVEESAYDMTRALEIEGGGALFLLPSSMKVVVAARTSSDAMRIAENQNPGYRAVGSRVV